MPLTDTAVKNAKPSIKVQKLSDGGGMYLEVTPRGGKRWRFKYRYAGKEKLLSLGVYPETALKVARERREELRKLLAGGIDPSENRKATRSAKAESAANSFEVIAREWLEKKKINLAEGYSARLLSLLERDLFPWLGKRPIIELTPREILNCTQRIETRGALDTAHRALHVCGQIFRFAVATARVERDPTSDLRGSLPPLKGGHFAAVTDPAQLGKLLNALDGYEGSFIVKCALRFSPLVFVRPGELRKARWRDFDLAAGEWRYLATKTNTPHIVPLSKQAIVILKELFPLTGHAEFVFPSGRGFDRPMSDNAVLAAMRRMGIPKEQMTGHGFRATARTILDEVLNFPQHLIEHQLAHAVRDPNGRAYNRTAHLSQRREMMQAWSNYLDGLKYYRNEAGLEVKK